LGGRLRWRVARVSLPSISLAPRVGSLFAGGKGICG
jgi:hypothetical protein